MRIRNCILLALLCFGEASVTKADVDAIRFRFNSEAQLTDIATSLSSASMALSSPIVETDGSLTDPVVAELSSEEETDALFLSSAEDEENETSSEDEEDPSTICTTAGGNFLTYRSNQYCCSTSTTPGVSISGLIYENGSWSSNRLMPQCGCYGDGIYQSMILSNPGNYYVCCHEHRQVESVATGASDSISDKGESSLCNCPKTVTKNETTYKVDELFKLDFKDGLLYCCVGDYRMQSATIVSDNEDENCKCNNDEKRKNCSEAACKNLGFNWCGDVIGCKEGECPIQCPEGSVTVEDDGNYICCQNGHEYIWNEDKTSGEWAEDISWLCVTCKDEKCGCPEGGTINEETNDCCLKHKKWDKNGYNTVDANVCGCASGSKTEGVCCDTDAGTYEGMDDSDESKSKAIRLCGCGEGKTRAPTDISGGFICCSGTEMTGYTSDVLPTPTESEIQKYCGCEVGQYSIADGACINGCVTDAWCAGQDSSKPYCDTENHVCVACKNSSCEEGQKCTQNGCKTCAEIGDGSLPHYVEGECHECSEDSHCGAGKICDPNSWTCETCVLYTELKDKNKGCENKTGSVAGETVEQPYCVQQTNGRGCSECTNDGDCKEKSVDRMHCLREQGICSTDCGSVDFNPETGECNCSGTTPVFNIFTKKCVTCYNSISGAWTDIGCNKVESLEYGVASFSTTDTASESSAQNYSPWQSAKTTGKPVCWEAGSDGNGVCVECTADDECEGDKICNTTNHTCACPSGKPNFNESSGKCVECTANLGASSGTRKCSNELKPYCDKTDGGGLCTCKDNYSTPKADGDGKCPQKAPTCSNGQCTCTKNYVSNDSASCPQSLPICNTTSHKCEVCPANHHYDATQKKCVQCDDNSTYNAATKKCVCKSGYGVIGNEQKCTATNTSNISGGIKSACGAQACQTTTLFEFTTVNNMLYQLQFTGTTRYGDWAQFSCAGAILDKTTSSGSGRATKKWCSNYSGKRDTNPNDSQYCTIGSSCTGGDGESCGRAVITTSDDNVSFLGDGGKCTFSVTNGNAGCTEACNATCQSGKPCINVVAAKREYSP